MTPPPAPGPLREDSAAPEDGALAEAAPRPATEHTEFEERLRKSRNALTDQLRELRLLHERAERELAERKAAETALRDSEERFRTLARHAPVGIFLTDPAGGTLYVNEIWCAMSGLGPAEAAGSGWLKAVHPDDREAVEAGWRQALVTRASSSSEFRFRHPDGTVVWVHGSAVPCRGADGGAAGYVGTASDITARKKADGAAHRLAAIVESSDDAIVGKDLSGTITSWNRGAERLFGYTAEEAVGGSILMLIPAELHDEEPRILERIRSGQMIDHFETIRRRKDGSRVEVSLTISPIRDAAGKIAGVSKIARDITARRQTESELLRARDKAVAAARSRDDFFAALTHELRTPLNPVLLLSSDGALNTSLPSAVQADFEMIRSNADLVAKLVDDLLDTTGIARGTTALDLSPCDLHLVLEEAVCNLKSEIDDKAIHLSRDLGAREHVVLGDRLRLRQIFRSLLGAAVANTPAGGAVVVETRSNPIDARLEVCIADSGVGLTASELAFIFDRGSPGQRPPGDESRGLGGMGLDVAIARLLLELHSGTLSASASASPHGPVFKVQLPVFRAPAAAPSAEPASAANGGNGSSLGRILIVEDHAPTRDTLARLLRRRHYDVLAAGSATEARSLAAGAEIDLIISDIGLPDGDGCELMDALSAEQPGMVGIALSGYGMENDVARSRRAGFAEHLIKPINIGRIEQAVKTLLRKKNPRADSIKP